MLLCPFLLLLAQAAPPHALDAKASDPARMGWMQGFPPARDKIIQFADGSFREFPKTRWAFSNYGQLLPNRIIAKGSGPVSALPRALERMAQIDDVTFEPIGASGQRMTWAQSLDANYTDGIVVLHKGRIVYEKYFGVLKPEGQHIAFSVTKSLVATLAATLVHEGKLDANALVTKYVPEVKDSGFGDATVRHLLDMTSGVLFSENYADPNAAIWDFSRANNLLPRPPGYAGPQNGYEYIKTLRKEYPHGERFAYKTVNTDLLAWVMSRVTGKSLADLMQEQFWNQLGVEQSAYISVDPAGIPFAGGGFNCALRDLARFGEMIRLKGRYNERQIVPAAVVEDIHRGASKEHFASAGYKTLPGWSYRNMWWVSHNEHGAIMARGIYGQAIYVDPKAEMVIARFASHPIAGNAVSLDYTTLPAFHAVAKFLTGN